MPKFQKTFCSQCGGEFGPGDHGYSHCFDHRSPVVNAEIILNEGRTDDGEITATLRGLLDEIKRMKEATRC